MGGPGGGPNATRGVVGGRPGTARGGGGGECIHVRDQEDYLYIHKGRSRCIRLPRIISLLTLKHVSEGDYQLG